MSTSSINIHLILCTSIVSRVSKIANSSTSLECHFLQIVFGRETNSVVGELGSSREIQAAVANLGAFQSRVLWWVKYITLVEGRATLLQ